MTEKPVEQGRVASLVSALRKLLSEDPLLFIVAVSCLVPLAAGIVANALAFEWGNTMALILVMMAVIILVVIPLTVTKGWKENQRKLSDARQTAIESEAERRTEQERNSQKRLNELFDAKIVNIKAQTDYILDQSERHEKRLLKDLSETLAEEMTKGLEFVEKAAKFDLSVTEVVSKLEANDVKFDSVLESLAKISRGLEDPKANETPVSSFVEGSDVVPHTQDISSYEKIITSKDQAIHDLQMELKTQKKYVIDLEQRLEKKPLQKEDIQISSSKGEIKSEILSESGKQALEDALKVVDNLEDDAPEISPESLLSEVEEIIKTPFPVGGSYDSQEDLAEVRPADPIPQSFWTCPKCNRANTLKRPRCMCGKSKPL